MFDLECFEGKSVNRIFEAIEQVVTNTKSHRIRHSKTLEEVKVEFLLLLTLIVVIVIGSMVNLYLVWLQLL